MHTRNVALGFLIACSLYLTYEALPDILNRWPHQTEGERHLIELRSLCNHASQISLHLQKDWLQTQLDFLLADGSEVEVVPGLILGAENGRPTMTIPEDTEVEKLNLRQFLVRTSQTELRLTTGRQIPMHVGVEVYC